VTNVALNTNHTRIVLNHKEAYVATNVVLNSISLWFEVLQLWAKEPFFQSLSKVNPFQCNITKFAVLQMMNLITLTTFL